MRTYVNSNDVIYVQCPHCKKGWYAKVLYYELLPYTYSDGTVCNDIIGPFGNCYLKSYVVAGMTETDLTKEIQCLNCGNKYTAINPISGPALETTGLMWDFVAQALTRTVGNY